ncbi:zona pellucida sperm-binding protein 4-like [Archocentrus centrarchus]|uniref:zona pellucida sperm-binding protein 4-like n=1 Tax=Archocentrus centrarchus TaxID=63155 RepID=UPI0011E9D42E|nr:zona pellucida sperm-binding protein 4-like [Archocentrus centrarchus]
MNPYINAHMSFEKSSTEQINHPFLSAKVKLEHDEAGRSASVTPAVQPPVPQIHHHGSDPVAIPLSQQHTLQTASFIHQLNPYQYYYHPYYYYQMYYTPGNQVFPASAQTSPPRLQASTTPTQHLTPPAQSMHDFHNWMHSPYYYLYYPSKVPKDDNELHPTGSKDSANKSTKSDSQLPSYFDYNMMDWFIRAAEAGYFNIPLPLHSPFHSLYSHYIPQQHHYDPSGQAGGDAKENLDSKMRDYLEAHTYTPSASPCGLGPESDTECSDSTVCCSNAVKDCTTGQYCVFAVPDSVVQPTVAPPAHSSEDSNASCTLQRLTPDLDIYFVPLDGCGVNKHMFGETVVHLLDVQGVHSYQDDSARESSPVRLMVGCSYSPDSPGEVRFHVMDEQPPLPFIQPTPVAVTVQLRIAKDETFTSYHPEAHLPLSLMQGRPVYVEVSLKDPLEPTFVLLIHSCLAYTEAPYPSGMLVYDGCSSLGGWQMLPSSNSHIRKIIVYSFLSLPPNMTKGDSILEDPEIYFLCLTEVCSGAHNDCTLRCLKGPNTGV